MSQVQVNRATHGLLQGALSVCHHSISSHSASFGHGSQQVCSVFNSELVEQCLVYIAENVDKAQQQPAQTLSELKAAYNDPDAHTGTARLSCCSLASTSSAHSGMLRTDSKVRIASYAVEQSAWYVSHVKEARQSGWFSQVIRQQ